MNFDMEMSVKIIVGICSVIGLLKVFTDVSLGKKSDLREDYDFSYRFFKEYEGNKDMPPILIEKRAAGRVGNCYAVSGGDSLSPDFEASVEKHEDI